MLCVVAASLSQIPDPAILGIRDEPSIIMFYGGSGLLAGFFGVLAVGSGGYLAISRFVSFSDRKRLLLLMTFLIATCAIVIAAVIRIFPGG